MQTNDSVARFVALRAALFKEREILEKRLQQINAALGGSTAALASASRASVAPARDAGASPAPKSRGRPPRSASGMSIREAITKVTSREPLGLTDLVDAVQRLGYKFESKNPRNSVGAFLYSKHGRKYFKRTNGKFSPQK